MPASLPPLPAAGGTYVLSGDGLAWELEQHTAEPGTPDVDPDPIAIPEDAPTIETAPPAGEV